MIKIKNATVADLDAIMKMEKSSFIPQIREDKKVFLERIKNFSDFFLIFYDENDSEKKIGYLCAEILEKIPETADEIKLNHIPFRRENQFFSENPQNKNDFSPFVYISSFCVFPENRGKGIGKKCWNLAMNYFENDARFFKNFCNTKGFLLIANEQWRTAISIYEKSGFETVKIFENFFPERENGFSNGILMKKSCGRRSNEI